MQGSFTEIDTAVLQEYAGLLYREMYMCRDNVMHLYLEAAVRAQETPASLYLQVTCSAVQGNIGQWATWYG